MNKKKGGCTLALIDVVGTMAFLTQDPLRPGVSLEINCSFTAAAKVGDVIRIQGKVLKLGKNIGFSQVDFFKDDKLLSSGRHTKAL